MWRYWIELLQTLSESRIEDKNGKKRWEGDLSHSGASILAVWKHKQLHEGQLLSWMLHFDFESGHQLCYLCLTFFFFGIFMIHIYFWTCIFVVCTCMYCLQVADAAPKNVVIVLPWEKQQCYTPSLHDIIMYHNHVQRPTTDLSCEPFEFSLNQSATNKS